MRLVAIAMVLLMLSGCSAWDELTRPDLPVKTSELDPDGWNTDGRFRVLVDVAGHDIEIIATNAEGRTLRAEGQDDVTLEIPDGTWDIRYSIDGHRWAAFDDVHVDATPPQFVGLARIGNAVDGAFTLGAGTQVQGAVSVTVIDQDASLILGTQLPVALTGLRDGLHTYLVTATDQAGNVANATVQVRVGTAAELPAGRYDVGVIARYSQSARVWDLQQTYLMPAEARAAVGNDWLGAGFGILPNDEAVQAVVRDTIDGSMDTMTAARALYRYMADHLEYDDSRLDGDGLLTPREVLLDTEDPAGRDANDDGLVDDAGLGNGNGVAGGICRDLAATYVSLLRAAGIPARLVSGYVGGTVNGFHAWVEFYAGPVAGQPAWVPVDVSPIDGPYRDAGLLQSFGVSLPDYLALRVVPSSGEKEGWSTALGVEYAVPSGEMAPDVQFAKKVTDVATDKGVLCFSPTTLRRAIAEDEDQCGAHFGFFVSGFVVFAERVVDYGIEVSGRSPGTTIEGDLAYPTPSGGALDHEFYPATAEFTLNVPAGKAHVRIA